MSALLSLLAIIVPALQAVDQFTCAVGYTCYEDPGADIVWVKRDAYTQLTCQGVCSSALINSAGVKNQSCITRRPVFYDIASRLDIWAGLNFTCQLGVCWDGIASLDTVMFTLDAQNPSPGLKDCYFPASTCTGQTKFFPCDVHIGNINCFNIRYSILCPCGPEADLLPPVFAAFWSCSYGSLEIYSTDDFIENPTVLADDSCSTIFDANTTALLGADATCRLSSTWASKDDVFITVELAPTSTMPVDHVIRIQSGVWQWTRDGELEINALTAISDGICTTCTYAPVIDVFVPSEIGLCDNLEFDLRANGISNLGGRSVRKLEYNISLASGDVYAVDTKYMAIESDSIEPGETVDYSITVTSWFGTVSTLRSTFVKLPIPIPTVKLVHPPTFDAYSETVSIGSRIAFDAQCLQDSIVGTFLYLWDVEFVGVVDGAEPFDASMFQALQNVVHANYNASLDIAVAANNVTYLQQGATYIFSLDAECLDMAINCSVTSQEAVIAYQYSPIVCQIAGGDKKLNVSLSALENATLQFDGAEWTFDPDGNALVFAWSCYDERNDADCSHLFGLDIAASTAAIQFDSNAFSEVNVTYPFVVSLMVRDANITSRASCVNSVVVDLHILGEERMNAENYLVAIVATSTSVSKADKIRLIASLTYFNGSKISDDSVFIFEWSTADDVLSAEQLAEYRVNEAGATNLVLDAFELEKGESYTFVLNVYHSSNAGISLAQSAVSIYVTTDPFIFEDGFIIDPEPCVHTFEHFKDSLFHPFSLFVSAAAEELPITFEFNAHLSSESDTLLFLHSPIVYQASLRNFVLPIDDSIQVSVTVTDFAGSATSKSMQCELTVSNVNDAENDCFAYESEVVDAYFALTDPDNLFSTAQTYAYVLQSAFSVLHYAAHNIDDRDCRYGHFTETMFVLRSHFDTDLCQGTDYFFVIELAQTLTKWLTVGDDFFAEYFSESCDNFDAVYRLLLQALDPCRVLQDVVVDGSKLLVTHDSVIINRVIVLYDDVDITTQLSVLLTQNKYSAVLMNLLRAYIDALSAVNSIDCTTATTPDMSATIAFLDRVFLVSGVSSICITIPSETTQAASANLEVFTIRDEQISSLDVAVNNVPISLVKNKPSVIGETDDVIVSVMTQPSQSNATYSGSDRSRHGTLGSQIVSVSFVNDTMRDGDVDIAMTFSYAYSADETESADCVWWNRESNAWNTDGCQLTLNERDQTVECRCSHLTTFSIIYYLKTSDEDNPFEMMIQSAFYAPSMIVFGVLFLSILAWILYNFGRLCKFRVSCKEITGETSMRMLAMVALLCVMQSAVCFISFSYKYSDFDASAPLILFLMTSLFVYYAVFAVVITTWMTVADSMQNSEGIKRAKKVVKGSAAVVMLVYVSLLVTLAALRDDSAVRNVVNVAATAWIVIMTLSTIGGTVYGGRVIKLLYETNKATQNSLRSVSNGPTRTQKAMRRISITAAGLTLFFVVQCAMTLYLTIDPSALSLTLRIVDLCTHFICLGVICVLYSQAVQTILSSGHYIDPKTESQQKSSKRASGKSKQSSKKTSTIMQKTRSASVCSIEDATHDETDTARQAHKHKSLAHGGANRSVQPGVTEMSSTTTRTNATRKQTGGPTLALARSVSEDDPNEERTTTRKITAAPGKAEDADDDESIEL